MISLLKKMLLGLVAGTLIVLIVVGKFQSWKESRYLVTLPLLWLSHVDQPHNAIYNNIELPKVWPPPYTLLHFYEGTQKYQSKARGLPKQVILKKQQPIPPYLSQPPAFINISIGRQLFVDDFLIDTNKSSDWERVYHQFQPGPTIQMPEARKPKGPTYPISFLFSDGVFYSNESKRFVAIMNCRRGEAAGHTCYSTSRDGINWAKPTLWGSNTHARDTASLWYDEATGNVLYATFPFVPLVKYHSLRLFALSVTAKGKVTDRLLPYQTGNTMDAASTFYNPFRQVWCTTIKHNLCEYVRMQYYVETRDLNESLWFNLTQAVSCSKKQFSQFHKQFEGWSPKHTSIKTPVPFVVATQEDPPRNYTWDPWEAKHRFAITRAMVRPTDVYHSIMYPYESLMLLFRHVHNAGEDFPKLVQPFVSFSRDGFHHYTNKVMPVVNKSPQTVYHFCGSPLVVHQRNQSSLWLYCGGCEYNANRSMARDLFETRCHNYLYKMRRDGFASIEKVLNSNASMAILATKPLVFIGHYMFVNVEKLPAGDQFLQVEVVVDDQTVLVSKPITKSGIKVRVEWASTHTFYDSVSLAMLNNVIVQLRFSISSCRLYSFWIASSKAGDSRGHLYQQIKL